METYAVKLVRRFPAAELINPSAEELDSGEEDCLAGNLHYRDLRGFTWDDVADVLPRERALFERFAAVPDRDQEAELFDEERIDALDELDAIWALDIGTAAATLALSALGAVPVASCNAGGFGGHHSARFPYVAFYIGAAEPAVILSIAESAGLGLDVIDPGLGRLFGRTNIDLHRFADHALAISRQQQG
ncbi:MAG: hypothetical protein ACJ798_12300 [Phenylobacterium sp.]